MKFVGRDREIKKLNTLYQDEEFQSLCRDLQTIQESSYLHKRR